MTGETVLIAAFSGRALAQSARRAGYLPLVADGYGDADTKESAVAFECVPEFVTTGITHKALHAALAKLSAAASRPPIGLVLGAGFEDHPGLVAALEKTFTLLGNSAPVIERCKDPGRFFYTLAKLGIPHPQTQVEAPAELDGWPDRWLEKRIGGSGGRHIRHTTAASRSGKNLYFQRKVLGDAISVLGIVSAAGDAFAFSRQSASPHLSQPYRYGGATGPLTLDEDLEARLIDTALTVAREFDLVGLVSFDFVINGDEALLIEVNPRPGATLDVFDDARGTLFSAHIAACTGDNPAELLQRQWDPPAARSAAYLYADRGPLVVNRTEWPEWVMDRPPPGTRIAARNPLLTVAAEAQTPDAAEHLCAERLGQMQTMLYDSAEK